MKSTLLVASVLALSIATTVHAVTPEDTINKIISAYRFYKEVPVPQLTVPTVVEVPFTETTFERNEAVVLNMSTGAFEPAFLKMSLSSKPANLSLQTTSTIGSIRNMTDGNTRTYAEYPLPQTGQGIAQIMVNAAPAITSASLTTLLDTNVALPTSIEIRARVGDTDTIVVAKKTMDGNTIRFPETTSNTWTITYTYAQPLRISELKFTEDTSTAPVKHSVRFLAQPKQVYRVYFDPDRSARPAVGESPNLASARDVLQVPAGTTKENPDYRISDVDADSVPDIHDNCVAIANADQADVNGNGRGDVCDDFDQDGVSNTTDNCPDKPNANQRDEDGDTIGDACDGEESRLTEKYAWLPWAGLGFAAFTLIALFAIMVRKTVVDAGSSNTETPTS